MYSIFDKYYFWYYFIYIVLGRSFLYYFAVNVLLIAHVTKLQYQTVILEIIEI